MFLCLVPWCFINLISKCFKNQLTEPGALPKMPYAQRSPGQINLTKNTRRHVHSSAYLTLPWFHHPPGNSRGGTNTGTLCRFRMGRKANCRAKVKPSTMCISKFMFSIYIYISGKLGIPEWFIQLSISWWQLARHLSLTWQCDGVPCSEYHQQGFCTAGSDCTQ